jgi:hypothetical protein
VDTGIPSSFQLLGHRITVRVLPRSKWPHGKDVLGIWEPDKLRIDILNDQVGTAVQATFTHELCHALLDMMNHELSHDETFVDNLGALLMQALTTFDFNKKPCEGKDGTSKSNGRTGHRGATRDRRSTGRSRAKARRRGAHG